MKYKLLFLIFFIVSPFAMYAQVGIGVEDPHPSAALEIVSKEKGLLISRMTLSEKNAILNPAESLLIYQTDGDIGFYYFDGSFWVYLKNINQINADWNATSGIAQILNKPAIAKAGTSGDFNDLLNIPAFVLASDTSKMLLPYLTLDKIQPFLDGKASVADLNKEMARAIQLEQQLAAIDVKVTANTSGIQTNATTIGLKENAANKSTDVTLADGTDTKFPTEKAVKTFVDGKVATLNTASTNMQAELDATKIGSGLATNGSYLSNTASNYIKTATSLKDATEKLDAQAKVNSDKINANTANINTLDTKVTANLANKVDKVIGKELSTNDYTTAEKTKLAAITGSNTGDQDLSAYATTTALDLKAPIANPTFTGDAKAETATAGDNDGSIATTAFVANAVSAATSGTFVDLTTNQTIAGAKNFSSDITVQG